MRKVLKKTCSACFTSLTLTLWSASESTTKKWEQLSHFTNLQIFQVYLCICICICICIFFVFVFVVLSGRPQRAPQRSESSSRTSQTCKVFYILEQEADRSLYLVLVMNVATCSQGEPHLGQSNLSPPLLPPPPLLGEPWNARFFNSCKMCKKSKSKIFSQPYHLSYRCQHLLLYHHHPGDNYCFTFR